MLKKFATDLSRGLRTMVRGIDADWDFAERRKTIRFQCRYKVDVTFKDTKKVAYVLDYSLAGLRFTSTVKFKIGEVVQVKFPHPLEGYGVRSLNCEVIWMRKNPKTLELVCGARFKETKPRMAASWIAYLFKEKKVDTKDLVEDRKFYRATCKLEVVARRDDLRSEGHIVDISTEGGCIMIDQASEEEETWGLDIKGLSNLEPMHIKATVLSCVTEAEVEGEPDPDGEVQIEGIYRQRVKFQTPLDEKTILLLQNYMQHLAKDFWVG